MNCLEFFARFIVFDGGSKIDNLNYFVLLLVNKEVFWFQVPVDDPNFVAVSNSLEHLGDYVCGVALTESDSGDDFFEKLAALAVFGNEKVLFGVFENFIKL